MNIYDIAQKAGVSTATVSRVLNGSAGVREQTKQKVLSVMEQEGYIPNVFARGLGLNSIKMVGILCTDVSDLYYAKAVSVLERELRERGFHTLLCCTGSSLEQKKRSMELLLSMRVDGLVLAGSAFREEKDNSHIAQAATQVPVVIVNGLVKLPNTYCVLCDEKGAVQDAVQEMAERGCRKLLYLYDAKTYSGMQKLLGFEQGVATQGISGEALQVEKRLEAAEQTVDGALQKGCDGILTSEDLLAAGALRATRRRNVSIPVLGCNNSLLAECTSPMLSSIDNRVEALCTTAVGILQDVFQGKEGVEKTVLSAKLCRRESF